MKLLLIIAGLGLARVVSGQGTAFTYQGRLMDNGAPATGNYDLRFAIYDAAAGGNLLGGPLTNAPVSVDNGAFTVILDFGQGLFPGANRWIEIGVRTNGSAAGFTILSPLQAITASPYAITAGGVTDANISRLAVPNTATAATGTPTVTSGFITGAVVTHSGLGYDSAPTVTVMDSTGSGAVITASVSDGHVASLTVQNPGTGYSAGATLTISAPPSNAFQTFVTPNFFTGVNTMTNPNNAFVGGFTGDGGGLTNLNAVTLAGMTAVNFWQLGGNSGSTAGVNFLGTTDDQGLELKVNSTRALRLEPNTNGAPNVIGGSPVNTVDPGVVGATISGGGALLYLDNIYTNLVSADFGTVGGGVKNTVGAGANYGTIDGGAANTIQADASFSTIGGGVGNVIQTNAQYSTVGGGQNNVVSAVSATVPGGFLNTAAGFCSFAAGFQAAALHDGDFVWADSQSPPFAATAKNQFLIRASGGVGIATNSPSAALHVVGPGQMVVLVESTNATGTWLGVGNNSTGGKRWSLISTGSGNGEGAGKLVFFSSAATVGRMTLDASGNLVLVGTLSQGSDRNVKTAIESVNPTDVLEQVSRLPVMTWAYTNDTSVRHIGPMAQDFYAAFGLGIDDKHIATVDEEGVALAALQGLNKKVEEKSAQIKELEARLARLEHLVSASNPSSK